MKPAEVTPLTAIRLGELALEAGLPDGVLNAVSLPIERYEIGGLPGGLHWDRILFCAKEATYKAWFPLTQRWLGFEDAHITFDVDATGARQTNVSRHLAVLHDAGVVESPRSTTMRQLGPAVPSP